MTEAGFRLTPAGCGCAADAPSTPAAAGSHRRWDRPTRRSPGPGQRREASPVPSQLTAVPALAPPAHRVAGARALRGRAGLLRRRGRVPAGAAAAPDPRPAAPPGWPSALVLGVFPLAALAGRFVAGRLADGRGRLAHAAVLGLVGHDRARACCSRCRCRSRGSALARARARPGRGPGLHRVRRLGGRRHEAPATGRGRWPCWAPGSGAAPASGPLLGGLLGSLPRVGLLTAGLGLAAAALVRLAGPAPAVTPDPDPGRRASLLPRPAVLPGVALALGNVGYAAIAGFLVLHLVDRGARRHRRARCVRRHRRGRPPGRRPAGDPGRAAAHPALGPGGDGRRAGGRLLRHDHRGRRAGDGGCRASATACRCPPSRRSSPSRSAPSERAAGIGALTAFYDVSVGRVLAGVRGAADPRRHGRDLPQRRGGWCCWPPSSTPSSPVARPGAPSCPARSPSTP